LTDWQSIHSEYESVILPKDRIREESIEVLPLVHPPPARPIAIISATAASISGQAEPPSDTDCHVGPPPREHGVASVTQPARPHCRVESDYRRAEVLRSGTELVHRHTLGAKLLRHLGGLPGIIASADNKQVCPAPTCSRYQFAPLRPADHRTSRCLGETRTNRMGGYSSRATQKSARFNR
jgi:hypothetical protein